MSDAYDEFNDAEDRNETPEAAVNRLRAELAAGDAVRPELAEALMQLAQKTTEEHKLADGIALADEAIELAKQLIGEGQMEFRASLGRCLLFRAALIRLHQGTEAGLNEFNETIRCLTELLSPEDTAGQNELAIALMNRADLLIDPLGAFSTAIASQEQAARIWQRLVGQGGTEYRSQLISVYMAQAEAKSQSGDLEAAFRDFEKAVQTAREGIDDGDVELKGMLVQALSRLTKLLDRLGNVAQAFETSREAIGLVEAMLEEGNRQVEPALTALYLQQGMLFEEIGNAESALAEFDRCRDVYLRMLQQGPIGPPGDYILRTGLANVLMCRGNMLADLKRFDEATESFEESIRRYRQAMEFRPEDDEDDSFISYSIAVVQLNLANMLVGQDRLHEAVDIKLEAIASLRKRIEAGHEEILPNLISAYRRLIGIRRTLRETERMLVEVDELRDAVSKAVDEGHLEYQGDLATIYRMRSFFYEEQDDLEAAKRDLLLSLRLFREQADDESGSSNNQWSKLQWGEILEHLAELHVRQGRIDEALSVFRKGIEDVASLLDEGNAHLVFDILFGYTQFVEFADRLLRDVSERETRENIRRWASAALETTDVAIELSCRQRAEVDADETSLDMFYGMKIAFLRQYRGSFLLHLERFDEANLEFSSSVTEWESLLLGLNRLRLRRRYFEQELKSEQEFSDQDRPADPGTEEIRSRVTETEETLAERWKYYMGELRQTLQRWALSSLAAGKKTEAEELFRREIDLTRRLADTEISNSDRFLILSLMTAAKALESAGETSRSEPLFEESAQLIRERLERSDHVSADYAMLKHVFISYALFLHRLDRLEEANRIMDDYVRILEHCDCPTEPELWTELCEALDLCPFWAGQVESGRSAEEIRRQLLERRPGNDDKKNAST